MRLEDSKLLAAVAQLGIEHHAGISLSECTSLGIGGTTDLLLVRNHDSIPALVQLLDDPSIPHKFLRGGSNLLVRDRQLPWILLPLAKPHPEFPLQPAFPPL